MEVIALESITISVPRSAINQVANAIEKRLEILEKDYYRFGYSDALAQEHSQLMNIFLQLMEV
jgi:hypothetical protein